MSGGEGSDHEAREEGRLLGVDAESPALIALAVAGSLALAGVVLRWPRARRVLLVVAAAMLLFAALDVREVVHQVGENQEALAVLAAVVALLHLSSALVGAALLRPRAL